MSARTRKPKASNPTDTPTNGYDAAYKGAQQFVEPKSRTPGSRSTGRENTERSKRSARPSTQSHEHRTAKVIELVASSSRGFDEAIQNALADARSSTRGITGAHVENFSIQCDDGRITAYKVNLKVSFGVERNESQGE